MFHVRMYVPGYPSSVFRRLHTHQRATHKCNADQENTEHPHAHTVCHRSSTCAPMNRQTKSQWQAFTRTCARVMQPHTHAQRQKNTHALHEQLVDGVLPLAAALELIVRLAARAIRLHRTVVNRGPVPRPARAQVLADGKQPGLHAVLRTHTGRHTGLLQGI
eukprot:GDKI01010638.1.p1 GENE.GDKI01010638.1~~GDKI01010638.1.p1  ORF type:complete len:162 (+),score=33.12 GDKI01010638.1:46-531(+)